MKGIRIAILILSACLASLAWGQPRAGSCTNDWTEFHGANMQRWDPCEKTLNAKNVRRLVLKWTSSLLGGSQAAIVDGVAYLQSIEGTVSALNADTGAALWTSQNVGGDYSSPAVVNGVVYVGTAALDAKTGALLWRYTSGSTYSAPTVANGVVYVGSDDPNLYALDAKTGTKLWSVPIYVDSSPAVADGVVYAVDAYSKLHALDAKTGAELWSVETGGSCGGCSSPSVANGVVYVDGAAIYALKAKTGAVLWSYSPAGDPSGSTPAVARGVVYVAASGHPASLYALDARTGAKLWSSQLFQSRFGFSPAVANGVVYLASKHQEYAFDTRTGAQLWLHKNQNVMEDWSYVAVSNGMVYVGDTRFGQYAFGLK